MLKFQAVAEKTAKSFRGLFFCRTLYKATEKRWTELNWLISDLGLFANIVINEGRQIQRLRRKLDLKCDSDGRRAVCKKNLTAAWLVSHRLRRRGKSTQMTLSNGAVVYCASSVNGLVNSAWPSPLG